MGFCSGCCNLKLRYIGPKGTLQTVSGILYLIPSPQLSKIHQIVFKIISSYHNNNRSILADNLFCNIDII